MARTKKAGGYGVPKYTDGGTCIFLAPTGVGKTISMLYPALKAVNEEYGERISLSDRENDYPDGCRTDHYSARKQGASPLER